LICHWPNGIVNPDRFADKAGHLVDFMATFIDLAGAEYPNTRNGAPVIPMQGESFSDVLFDQEGPRATPIFLQYSTGEAMIDGDYKLLKHKSSTPWKLFNLSVDATELNDLSTVEPAKYNELLAAYSAWHQAVKDNDMPAANDDDFYVSVTGDTDLDVLENDVDLDGSIDSGSLTITSEALYGSAIVTNGMVRYTPGTAITRFDRFAYQCQDNDGELSNIAYATVRFGGGTTNSPEYEVKIEAEDATTTAGVTDVQPTASAGWFVNFNPANPAQYIEWEVTIPSTHTYDLSFGYANGTSLRYLKLFVNDQLINDSLGFPGTGWDTFILLDVPDISLNEGANTIRVETFVSTDGPNMDYLRITTASTTPGADTDLDEMPDWYEDLIPGLDKNSPADATTDLDGDGSSNVKEYWFNTDPLNPDSKANLVFEISSATESMLSWPAIFGETYELYKATSLLGAWTPFTQRKILSTEGRAWTDRKEDKAFYKLATP